MIKAEPTVVFKESYVRNGAALDITFEKVARAKLHKNVQYFDEWRAEKRLASASQLVRAACLPGSKPDCDAASRVASARRCGCKPIAQPQVRPREGSERERAQNMHPLMIQAFAWAWGCARAAAVSTMWTVQLYMLDGSV